LETIEKSSQDKDQASKSLDPACQAICALVARCILAHPRPMKLASTIVSRYGMKMSTIHILICLMNDTSASPSDDTESINWDQTTAGSNDNNHTTEQDVLAYAVVMLLDSISTSAYLRERLCKSNGSILANTQVSFELVIPKLVGILSESHKTNAKDAKGVVSAVGTTITSIMERQVLRGSTNEFACQVVSVLEKIAEDPADDTKGLIGYVCSTFAGRWRRDLLEKKGFGDEDFGEMLKSIGRGMLLSPASVAPLTFFGALVGEDLTEESIGICGARYRILLAVEKIMEICTGELKQRDKAGSDAIFARLSPLLMLRRVPTLYFKVARKESMVRGRNGLQDYAIVLVGELAGRLDIDSLLGLSIGQQGDISAGERRLAAEIAGRCLSFGEVGNNGKPIGVSQSCATFERICAPAFAAFIRTMDEEKKGTDALFSIRRARAALYAACNHIPYCTDDEYYEHDVYRQTASFALYAISVDADMVGSDTSVDLVQLQTGCIEFFALCVEKTLKIRLGVPSRQLVQDAHENKNSEKVHSEQTGFLASNSLQQISRAIVSILQSGKHGADAWICSAKANYLGHSSGAVESYSIPARTCLWNSLIVVSQRSSDKDGSVEMFARSALPWITDWGAGTRSDDQVHHPLCIAAALQVTFILLTRLKSLAFFAGSDRFAKEYIRRAHGWALQTLKDKPTSVGDYSNRAQRLAALKLLLSIVTVDSINSDGSVLPSCLGPGELGEAFTVIHGLSNMDPDSEVRGLSSHLLSLLKND
jgi:hypothetical protein